MMGCFYCPLTIEPDFLAAKQLQKGLAQGMALLAACWLNGANFDPMADIYLAFSPEEGLGLSPG